MASYKKLKIYQQFQNSKFEILIYYYNVPLSTEINKSLKTYETSYTDFEINENPYQN